MVGSCLVSPRMNLYLESSFGQMWNENRDHVRRILLALAQDVDLAEDCLQDTYLHATSGITGYRGENPRAWLGTIARNVFYGHARRKRFSSEVSLETAEEQMDDSLGLGSDDHLDLLAIRDAISALDPHLRKALIMRHYGEYDYEEIGSYLSCPAVVAKHRVWRAMQKLRNVIGNGNEGALGCSELRGTRALDWLYGALSMEDSANIESHIAHCGACKQNIAEIKKLAGLLDKADGDHRMLTLIDLDEFGHTTRYAWVKQICDTSDIKRTWHWNARDGWKIEYLALQGEPVEVRWPGTSSIPGFTRFEGDLPKPVEQGQVIDAMFIAHPPDEPHWVAKAQVNGMWQYRHMHTPFPRQQALLMVTIRLPKSAKLRAVDPAPYKSSTRAGRTSLTWRVITEIVDSQHENPKWQFEANLEYVLSVLSADVT
ncbi:MAG: RNA polymerase sigma factor [Armatimonadota bacterium]